MRKATVDTVGHWSVSAGVHAVGLYRDCVDPLLLACFGWGRWISIGCLRGWKWLVWSWGTRGNRRRVIERVGGIPCN